MPLGPKVEQLALCSERFCLFLEWELLVFGGYGVFDGRDVGFQCNGAINFIGREQVIYS